MTVTLLLSIPVYHRLENIVDKYAGRLCDDFKDFTGLSLSYGSVSPSVLAYLGVKNITISDSTDRIMGQAKSVHIKYKLLPLLRGDYEQIVKGVVVDGIDLDVEVLVDYIVQMVQEYLENKEPGPVDYELIYSRMKMVMDYIPPNVSVKNANVKYRYDILSTSMAVKEIKIFNVQDKNAIDFAIKGAANLIVDRFINAKGDVVLNGSLTKAVEDSFVNINLSNFTQDKYKLTKLNFLLSYNDKKLLLRTVQNVIPVNLQLCYGFEDMLLDASVKTENLKPISVFSSVSNNNLSRVLKESQVSVNGGLSYDFRNFKLKYDSNGSILIPDFIIPGTADVNYSLSGNDKSLDLKHFAIEGQNCNADVELSFIYKTLQLSGFAELANYTLPNGTVVSTEVYFDPLASGFMLFSPQIFIGDKALTAMQARVMPQSDSIDFDFEVNDFSHMDEDSMGVIKADGSYLTSSNYIQTSLSLSSIYLDTILGVVKELVPQDNAGAIQKTADSVAGFMFSGDAYFSTDLKSVSYNIPYLVLANTRKENQLLLIALNGNEQSIQLNRFNMIYGPVALEATASLDTMPDSQEKFYTVDIISSSIPYHFSGNIMPELITLAGDYGVDAELRLGKNKKMGGFALCQGIPFIVNQSTYTVAFDSLFDYDQQQGPQVTLSYFQIEKDTPDSSINPRLEISGTGTRYGAQLDSILYTDLYSSLKGNSDITINIDNSMFNSAGIQLNLLDPLTDERIVIDAQVSNPDGAALNSDNLLNSIYLNAMAEISNFSLNRFNKIKNDNNELTASLYVSGTVEHPYVTASVQKLTFLFNNSIVSSSGSIVLEDRDLTVNDFVLDAGVWGIRNITGNASLNDFSGHMTALFAVDGYKTIYMPLEFVIEDSYVPDNSSLPQSFTAKLSSPGIEGTLFKKPVAFDFSLNYTKDFLSFYSSENFGLYGTFSSQDGLFASWKMGDIISTDLTGKFDKDDTLLKLSNINMDLAKLFQNLTLDEFFIIEQGLLKGSVSMRGSFVAPEFKGALSVANPSFQLPFLFNQRLTTEKILITAANNEFSIPDTVFKFKNTPKARINSHVYMNRWALDHFDMKATTLENQTVPVKFKNPLLKLDADTECNISVVYESHNIDVSGSVSVENLNIVSDITELSNTNLYQSTSKEPINLTTDLNLKLGTHSSLNFNPLLRCVFVPHSVISCKIDTASGLYQLDGSLQFKSGDVAYLSRSFYIKEGNIKFNPSDIANPMLTIKAETRERDDQGQTIRVILSAENQYLLDFNPRFSSVPPKSENEIKLLMGQIVLADSESVSDLVLSAGDYYLQSTVVRNIENKLRDLLNFDIFSVRTNLLQNTISMSMQRNNTKEVSIGNFFDNSTVYIGKYIGSALYVDAMLNMSASDNLDAEYLSTGYLLFQPELGLELELPVLNVRWDMTWDINPGMKLKSYVPSTSVSLSWKMTF